MSVEMEARTGGSLLVSLLKEAFSSEPQRSPINYKEYGRIGPNYPYNIVVRKEVVRDFLQTEMGLRSDQVDRAFIFVIGEKPHKIPAEDLSFAFPQELRSDPKAVAYIHEHPTVKVHSLSLPVFRLWKELKTDRDIVVNWWERKPNMKTLRSWGTLGRKTHKLLATEERRMLIEQAQTREDLELVIAKMLSHIGTQFLVEQVVHEGDHSGKFRRREDLWWFTKPNVLRSTSKTLEDSAEKAEEELDQKWYHMLDFRVNPRRLRKKKIS